VGPVAARRLSRRRGELSVLPSPDDIVLMRPTGERRRLRLAGEITAPGSMCDVVTMIAHSHFGGELVVVDDNATRSIFFEPDHVISAESSAHAERLGEVLYRQGALRREQLAAALSTERNIRFGEAVILLRYLSLEQLFSLMSRQIDEIFQAVVTADTGLFLCRGGGRSQCRHQPHRQRDVGRSRDSAATDRARERREDVSEFVELVGDRTALSAVELGVEVSHAAKDRGGAQRCAKGADPMHEHRGRHADDA
jgi:hypothetical protein